MTKRVLFAAAENGLVAGLKVGGIADVVAGLAPALASEGWDVTIITPAYAIHKFISDGEHLINLTTPFAGRELEGRLYQVDQHSSVTSLVIDCKEMNTGQVGEIYIDDGGDAPFASDANRFAMFSSLVADYLARNGDIQLVHLHDWHLAPLLLLRAFSEDHAYLRSIPFVYTIHNLALQGIRPLRDHESSLFNWYPDLQVDQRVLDPRWQDCVNLMRTGINLADGVNTVSPSYAREILNENDETTGFHGGEGLEIDLQQLVQDNRLKGILNGCDYPVKIPGRTHRLTTLMQVAASSIYRMLSRETHVRSNFLLALKRIEEIKSRRRQSIVVSIGRLTDQKVGLLMRGLDVGTVLEKVLRSMGDRGVLILLGTGDPQIERFFNEAMHQHDNFLFIAGFDLDLANDLYKSGHLFLMPSSFEPCGISQMLAMRVGQPCLVHAVGGLRDTVNEHTGWTFEGGTPRNQATALIEAFEDSFSSASNRSNNWQQVRKNAQAERFTWHQSAESYIAELYTPSMKTLQAQNAQ